MHGDDHDEDRAAILARRQRFIALALGGLATGCTPGGIASNGDTSSEGASESDVGETTDGGSTSESTSETDTDTDTAGFVPPRPRPCLSICDTFAQDCPEGEKCVPYASDGERWDSRKCVPVSGDRAAGEPCVSGGIVDATDDCDGSAYCWDVEAVDDLLVGVCAPFCGGTADDWTCEPGSNCLIANDGSISLCIDACDPLAPECGDGRACTWNGQTFGCLVTTGEHPVGDACGFANDCEPGSLCLDASVTPDCLGSACCVETCATDDPQACAGDLECAAFFAEGRAPPGSETLGVCVALGTCGGLGCVEHANSVYVDD